jgi:RHS repeat-associated protein
VTYQDQTSETYAYDAAHNLIQRVDARGTTISQSFDAANRLTSVHATGTGLEGPVTESYTYDGLDRLTLAQSGDLATGMVTTERTYDSLSGLRSETSLGRTVSYSYDDAGNPTGVAYPSGVQIGRQFDPLDRPQAIGPVVGGTIDSRADYGYRGPRLPAEKRFGSGLVKTWQYDGARRPLDARTTNGTDELFQESLTWSPRNLKTSTFRGDINGRGWTLEHDPSGRLLHAASQVAATATVSNNDLPTGVSAAESRYSYTFDTAENLLTRQLVSQATVEEDVSLPPDDRNRPGSMTAAGTGTTTLTYDANGNLTDKPPFKYYYDFRNRLTRVTSSGIEVARYDYDVFNRRVRLHLPAHVETPAQEVESVWSGWQEIEQYRQGQLYLRMTYGRGLDEVVRLEADSDLNGMLETDLVPHYDATGNLVLLTDSTDGIVGQYGYSPMGEHMAAKADGIAPEVCQVTVANGDIAIEFCEEVRKDSIEVEVRHLDQPSGFQSGTPVKTTVLPATHTFPVQEGRQSHRRLIVTPTDQVTAGAQVELYIPAEGVKDLFLNPSTAPYSRTFTWPATSSLTVLEDTAPPEVEELRLRDGFLEVSFSEPPILGSVLAAIYVNGQTMTWLPGTDGYTVRSEYPLLSAQYTVTIAAGAPLDQDGKGLATTFEETIDVDAAETNAEYYEVPDPRVVPWTTFVNRFALHGRPLDVETGLLYFRNRYYDPELGRFITTDPMGYVDGPSMYQFAGYSPHNTGDPLGLETGDLWAFEPGLRQRMDARRAEISKKRDALTWLRFEIAVREYLLPIDPLNRREELRQLFDATGINNVPAAGLVGYFLGPPGTVGSSPSDRFHSALGGGLAGTADILDTVLQIELAAVGLVEIAAGAGGLADEAININRYRAGLRADIQSAIRQRVLRNVAASQRGRPTEAFRRYAAIDRGFPVPRGKLNIPTAGRKFNQIERRGWSDAGIRETVQTPHATRAATNKATGKPATAYFNRDGSHVVVDDVTGDLVQLSDRTNPRAWVPDPTIQDPYLPPE